MSENEAPLMPEEAPPHTTESPRRTFSRKALAIGAAAVIVLGVGAAIAVVALQPSAIERAGASCSGTKPLDDFLAEVRASASATPEPHAPEDSTAFDDIFDGVIAVEDGGSTLIVNTKPEDDDPLGLTSLALDCVYEQLDVPKRITERIGSTRSLDGRQEGSWDGFSASWSYHPDSGANLIIVQD